MRIVYVLTSLGMGGAERQALAVAHRMAQRGHTVAVLVLRPALAEQWPTALSVVHLGISKTPTSAIVGMATACRFVRDFKPDLLHSHSFHANIAARLLKLIFPRTTAISTIHNVYEGGWQRMLAYRLTDCLATRTAAVSQATAERFVRLHALSRERCIVLPNGIDLAAFAPDSNRRALMRCAMGAADSFIWLAAGRLVPAKDYPNLLRAFALLRHSRPDARLWIAGESLGLESSRIGTLASDMNLQDSVRWLGLQRDMPGLLDAADAFVQASAWEGMPLAVGEAMAMQKPVVVTNVGGLQELVGDCGAIVPPRDSNAVASAMLTVMQQSHESRQAQGWRARERIERQFSMESRADAWEDLYARLLAPQ